jgi:hypothetical protein
MFKADRTKKNGKISEWSRRLNGSETRFILVWQEHPLTDHTIILIEQMINDLKAKVGHANPIAVRVE